MNILINQSIQEVDESIKIKVLNPNEVKIYIKFFLFTGIIYLLFFLQSFADSSDEIFKTLDYLIATKYSSKKLKSSRHPSSYLSAEQLDSILQKYNFISSVKNLSEEEFFNILDNNSKRFDPTLKSTDDPQNEVFKLKTSIINSVCNPQTILLIKEKYITETFSNNL